MRENGLQQQQPNAPRRMAGLSPELLEVLQLLDAIEDAGPTLAETYLDD